jgi:hypothetical protein
MKKITNILLTTLVLTSVSFITSPAKADDQCTSANPCGTWAVVDSSGVVTNIIVCEERVCGSGTFAGMKVVLQVPPNPVTNQSQGGYLGTPNNSVTYNEQTQVFSQGNTSFPAPVTRTEVVDTTTLSATINSNTVTFGPSKFVNGQMQFTPKIDSNTVATISAIQGTTVERQTFTTPKTKLEIEQSIQGRLNLIQRYLNRFYELLKGWILD